MRSWFEDHPRMSLRMLDAAGASAADLEADRQVANTLAELIIGGSLVSADIVHPVSDGSEGSVSGRSIQQPGDAGTAA